MQTTLPLSFRSPKSARVVIAQLVDDAILIGIPLWAFVTTWTNGSETGPLEALVGWPFLIGFFGFLELVVTLVFRRTVGQAVLGLRLVSATTGERALVDQVLIRAFVHGLTAGLPVIAIGDRLLTPMKKDPRAMYDKAARTVIS
jgi:RDD family protein